METLGDLFRYTLTRAIDLIADHATAVFFSIFILVLISFVSSLISRDSNKPNSQSSTAESSPTRIQPRWQVFQILNYCVLVVFIGSITFVAINYKQSINYGSPGLQNLFLPLMILWGSCLAWFFGFFGISFLDSESIENNDNIANSNNNNHSNSNNNNSNNSNSANQDIINSNYSPNSNTNSPARNSNNNNIDSSRNDNNITSRKAINIIPFQHFEKDSNHIEKLRLQPRHDTIICSDKVSLSSLSKIASVSSSTTTSTTTATRANDDNSSNNSSNNASSSLKIQTPLLSAEEENFAEMSDDDIFTLLLNESMKDHQLEKKLGDYERAVKIRRMLYNHLLNSPDRQKLDQIPYEGYDFKAVFGVNCEIVIGYIPIPVGIVGPLVLNGESVYIPMATTEGCLVASTNRGCKALTKAGGCQSVILKDGITRAPCLKFPSALRAAALKSWLEIPENYSRIEAVFNSTTSYGRLESIDATIAGRNIYLRFCCMSGDAMGMNMVSKGSLKCIEEIATVFPDMQLIAISGNMCTDKKPSAINWILGRGKSVVVEAVISEKIVKEILKTTVKDVIETNKQKNHIGSAMAGSIGGFNAHAANVVTAIFIATGQDPAQNVESCNCLTVMEYAEDEKSLYVSVTMPCIEVGTIGGGTHLPAQSACLDICGVQGPTRQPGLPGDNSRKFAQIIGAGVLAGELSLIAALAANHLVRSHMQHNRRSADTANISSVLPTPSKGLAMSRKHNSMPDLSQLSASATISGGGGGGDTEKDNTRSPAPGSSINKLPFDSSN